MNYFLLIQTIISAVKSIEALMPASKGEDKLNAVIVMIESVVGTVQPMLPAIQGIITALVSSYHAAGVFTKKAA